MACNLTLLMHVLFAAHPPTRRCGQNRFTVRRPFEACHWLSPSAGHRYQRTTFVYIPITTRIDLVQPPSAATPTAQLVHVGPVPTGRPFLLFPSLMAAVVDRVAARQLRPPRDGREISMRIESVPRPSPGDSDVDVVTPTSNSTAIVSDLSHPDAAGSRSVAVDNASLSAGFRSSTTWQAPRL